MHHTKMQGCCQLLGGDTQVPALTSTARATAGPHGREAMRPLGQEGTTQPQRATHATDTELALPPGPRWQGTTPAGSQGSVLLTGMSSIPHMPSATSLCLGSPPVLSTELLSSPTVQSEKFSLLSIPLCCPAQARSHSFALCSATPNAGARYHGMCTSASPLGCQPRRAAAFVSIFSAQNRHPVNLLNKNFT